MHSKLYLLFTVLFVFVICAISIDEQPRKDDPTVGLKRKIPNYSKGDNEDQELNKVKTEVFNYDMDEEDDIPFMSYGQSRYSPTSNYRPRSRWSGSSSSSAIPMASSSDYAMNENDRSRSGYGNGFPGSLPSMSFDTEMLLGGPKCYSLVDPQYSIISDTCGAIPQARYTLPNLFGHRDRWQVAQALAVIMSSSTDPVCTRSLRHLLCPTLLPSCPTRNEPSPSLPCQSFCRAIKTRCSSPALDHLPCEIFPYSSDYCPTNQHYGSLFPQGAFPSNHQLFPTQRSPPSLQSILSLAGLQSSSASNSPQTLSPMSPYNNRPYSSDSMLTDFPSRSYTKDYRQGSRYAPLTRSSAETRPTADMRLDTSRYQVTKA